MLTMKAGWKNWILLCVFISMLSGCTSQTLLPDSTATPERAPVALTPYIYSTLTPSINTTIPDSLTATPLPSPSPTPRSHTVTAGQTFGTIATQYGVSVDALRIANPEVDPNAIPLGTVLIIPYVSTDETAENILPTPIPIQLAQPDCYQDSEKRIICFVAAFNPLTTPVEGVTAVLRYQSSDGSLKEASAFNLLNTIQPGKTVPLYAVFPVDENWDESMSAELRTAIPAQNVPLCGVENIVMEQAVNNTVWVSGILTPPDNGGETCWVLGVGQAESGRIVAARRLTVVIPANAGGTSFRMQLFSLAGEIQAVDVQAEPAP